MPAGDDRALGELYDRHGATLYALAVAIARERADAEEIVADALGQAWRTASQFDPGRGSVGAWLATITRSRALDLVRARGRRARALARAAGESGEGLSAPLAAADAPERRVERQEARQLVGRSLAELPEPQRRVIELAYFTGLTQTEIAAELREPLGTVKTRMRAGMEKLRDSLARLLPREGPRPTTRAIVSSPRRTRWTPSPPRNAPPSRSTSPNAWRAARTYRRYARRRRRWPSPLRPRRLRRGYGSACCARRAADGRSPGGAPRGPGSRLPPWSSRSPRATATGESARHGTR